MAKMWKISNVFVLLILRFFDYTRRSGMIRVFRTAAFGGAVLF